VTEAASERELKQLQQKVEYALQPTLRGITLLDSIKNVGLTDIENRDDDTHVVPPSEFYKTAKKEVFISGLTLERSFDQGLSSLQEILAAGLLLRVMILRPDAECISWLTVRERRNLGNAIRINVIEVARKAKFIDHPNFKMRLMERFPTFSAVMLDGDIEGNYKESLSEVHFRIQPTTIHKTHHQGLVIQMRMTPEIPHSLFNFVAEELREQWATAIDLDQLPASL